MPKAAPPKQEPRTRYTQALSERICFAVSNGTPLRQVCRDEGIHWTTVYDWRKANKDFAERLADAREIGEEAIAAECLEIADTPLEGVETTEKASGTEIRRTDMLGHRKLQIETRLKLLAKWNPAKWGDKVETTHKGDPTAPVALVLNGSDVHG